MLNFNSFSTNRLVLGTSAKPLKALKAEVILGVLRNDCRGLGICKINPLGTSNNKCSVTNVIIEKLDNELIRFRFVPTQICKKQLIRQFSEGFFTMEDNFVLPNFLVKELQLKKSFIGIGKYHIAKDNNDYYVSFYLNCTKNLPQPPNVYANALSEFPNMLVPLMPLV